MSVNYFPWRYFEANPLSAQFPRDFPQDSEFALRVTEEWAVTQEKMGSKKNKIGMKGKQRKTKSRLCNRTPVSFLVLEMVAVYLLVARSAHIGLDRG